MCYSFQLHTQSRITSPNSWILHFNPPSANFGLYCIYDDKRHKMTTWVRLTSVQCLVSRFSASLLGFRKV